MGVIYEAFDRQLERTVAIKVAEETNAEAQLTATLEHPGVVPVHDAGLLPDGRPFYVMKLVRGEVLTNTIPSSENERLRIFLRICETVAFAHARGIVHCDLKPSNIMRGEFGEVLVMDWGIANRRGGTPGYIAPEQAEGHITPAADVFALGTLLGQMSAKPTRRLRAIIRKATANEPAARYATANELADDVSRYLDDRDLAAYRESPLERVARWASRNRALLAVVGAYIVMRILVLVMSGR